MSFYFWGLALNCLAAVVLIIAAIKMWRRGNAPYDNKAAAATILFFAGIAFMILGSLTIRACEESQSHPQEAAATRAAK